MILLYVNIIIIKIPIFNTIYFVPVKVTFRYKVMRTNIFC